MHVTVRRSGRTRIVAALGLAALAFAVSAAGTAAPASAVQTAQNAIVSADPVGWTPHVLDGRVKAIVQAGNTIVLGGSFTQVSSADGETVYERRNLVAFDATTGEVNTTFAPDPDDEVTSLVVSPDGKSVIVGGFFDAIDGKNVRTLAKVRLSDGSLVEEFKAPDISGRIKDMKLADGRLWIAGTWKYIAGKIQPALATLHPRTGAFDSYNRLQFSGPYNDAVLQVLKLDIAPDGKRLVAIGNFSAVEDLPRPQLAVLDLGEDKPSVADWHTDFFEPRCAKSYDSYMHDVDISPDGEYFVITTTGAWRGADSPCDTTSRWELDAKGSDLEPTWVNYSGGDTMWAVAVTGPAVYIGGHFRWQNNPNTLDGRSPGPGAVAREGIAALDPVNGLPLSWNPGRTKGVGVFDMLATDKGLWVGSDTDRIGNWEYHGRIAFFPLSGGSKPPSTATPRLPGDVHLQPFDDTSPIVRSYDGKAAGTTGPAPADDVDWSDLRGATVIGGKLYHGWADGAFLTRRHDGTTFGESSPVDGADQLTPDEAWHSDLEDVTGMFYDDGRLYYTLAGDGRLYYRYFTVESNVVGATRFVADEFDPGADQPSIDYSKVRGMFLDGSHLYWAHDADGTLHRATFSGGTVDASTDEVVSGPDLDGNDWRSRGTYVLAR